MARDVNGRFVKTGDPYDPGPSPAERLIIRTVVQERDEGDVGLASAIRRAAANLGLSPERVLRVYAYRRARQRGDAIATK